jgi:hypothetical protein
VDEGGEEAARRREVGAAADEVVGGERARGLAVGGVGLGGAEARGDVGARHERVVEGAHDGVVGAGGVQARKVGGVADAAAREAEEGPAEVLADGQAGVRGVGGGDEVHVVGAVLGRLVFESELIGLLSTEGDASVSWVRYGLLTNTIV